MKSLILLTLISFVVAFIVSFVITSASFGSEHYGSAIPALPEDGVLYHADVLDCNPEDYEADDPHFYLALGYLWDGDDPMFAVVFYLNTDIDADGLGDPSVVFYGADEEPTIFVRVVTTVERFEGFKDFIDMYPASVCSVPRPEEEI